MMTFADDDGGCIAGEVGVGSVVSGIAVVAYKRPGGGSNCADAVSTVDSVGVCRLVTKGELGFLYACNHKCCGSEDNVTFHGVLRFQYITAFARLHLM